MQKVKLKHNWWTGNLPQPHRYAKQEWNPGALHLPSALRAGSFSSAHPLKPGINSSPGPRDYGIFPGATLLFSQRTKSREAGTGARTHGKPPACLCRGLSRRQDCIYFHISGLPSSVLEAQRQYLAWLRGERKEGSLSFP